MGKEKKAMLTPREFATKHAVSYTGVMKWIRLGWLEGVERQELPFGGFVYAIPADTPRPARKPGPLPGAKKARAKKTGGRSRKPGN